MRVVLDTNVVVAAGFSKRSASATIVEALRAGRHQLVWNDRTRRETRAVVQRIPPLDWSRLRDIYRQEDRFDGDTHPERHQVVDDPPDRAFSALAEAADAVLVSNDSDLLSVRDQLDVTVLTPSELVRRHP